MAYRPPLGSARRPHLSVRPKAPASMRRHNLLGPPTITPYALVVRRDSDSGAVRNRRRLLRQGDCQHLVDPLHRLDLEFALDVLRDLDQVLLVLIGDEHRLDAAAMR